MTWFRCLGDGGTPIHLTESYIYPVGQVGFNTGHIHTANTKVKFKACFNTGSFTEWGEFFGARRGGYENNAFCFFPRFRADRYGFCRTGQETVGELLTGNENASSYPLIFVPCIFEAVNKSITWYAVDNPSDVKQIICNNGTVDGGIAPLAIFTFNNATSAGGWSPDGHTPCALLYWFEIYESDVLVHRYVPAYNNSQWCLYDEVDEEYIYDARNNGAYLRGHLAN